MDTDPYPDGDPVPDRQALHLDADPDPPKICRSDRIRIHNTANTACNGQGSMQFQFLTVNVPGNLDSRRTGFYVWYSFLIFKFMIVVYTAFYVFEGSVNYKSRRFPREKN
jgi:hypothetical protein